MNDLLAARSQMAMSLAFHIIFAAIGIAMPLLISGLAVGVLALIVFLLARSYAPKIRARISASPWAMPLQIATAMCALGAFGVALET